MKFLVLFCYALHFLAIYCQIDDEDVRRSQERLAEMMKHDGVNRVTAIDAKNIEKILKKNPVMLVMFWMENKKDSEKITERDMNLLEVVAQIFQGKKIAVCTCEIMANQQFAMLAGVRYSGMMKIVNRNKISTYYGQRSPDVLMPYISKLFEPAVKVIKTKSEKKFFDENDLVKVIAHVAQNSKEHKVFEEVALNFHPMISFYAIFDAKLAKVFHLKKTKSLQIIKPYEKLLTYPQKGDFTEKAIVKFIESNKAQRLTKMRLENLHEIWSVELKGVLVPVFADTTADDGKKFFAFAKSLSKQYEKHDNLSFIWIDPKPFPTMLDYWAQSFMIDPLKPNFGVVDVHKEQCAWYREKNDDDFDFSLKAMKKWLEKYLAGEIELRKMSLANQANVSQDSNTDERDEL